MLEQSTQFTMVCQTHMTAPPRVGCVVWSRQTSPPHKPSSTSTFPSSTSTFPANEYSQQFIYVHFLYDLFMRRCLQFIITLVNPLTEVSHLIFHFPKENTCHDRDIKYLKQKKTVWCATKCQIGHIKSYI